MYYLNISTDREQSVQNCLFQGCYDKIIGMATSNLNIVFGSLIGLGAVQFVAIVFAFCVCKVSAQTFRILLTLSNDNYFQSVGLQERAIYYNYYK